MSFCFFQIHFVLLNSRSWFDFFLHSTCRRLCLTVNEVTDPNATSTLFSFFIKIGAGGCLAITACHTSPSVGMSLESSSICARLFSGSEIIADKPNCGDAVVMPTVGEKNKKLGESHPLPSSDSLGLFESGWNSSSSRFAVFFLLLECVGPCDVRERKNQMSAKGDCLALTEEKNRGWKWFWYDSEKKNIRSRSIRPKF